MELDSKNTKKILLIIFLGSLMFTVLQNFNSVLSVLGSIYSVFSPVIAALCIAFVLNVLLAALETRVFKFWDKSKRKFVLRLKRPVCLILTYLIAFGLVALLILVIIPNIVDTITYLASKMPGFLEEAKNSINSLMDRFNLEMSELPDLKIDWNSAAKTVTDWLSGSSGKIVDSAVNITTSVFSGIFNTLFSFVISVYVLAQKEKIGAFIKRLLNAFLPNKANGFIYHVSLITYDLFSRFIGGQILEAIIVGVLCFIGMSIFRFPNALIISAVISATALVPIVGSTIGVIIGFLLIVITNPIKALLFVLFFIILQQIEGNLIYPKVVGKAVGLPGVLVVSAVMVGGNIGGVMGTLISVPTVAVLFTLLKELVDFASKRSRITAHAMHNEEVDSAGNDTDDDNSDSDNDNYDKLDHK